MYAQLFQWKLACLEQKIYVESELKGLGAVVSKHFSFFPTETSPAGV